MKSVSAKLLASGLGIQRIRPAYSRFNPRTTDTVIYWGKGRNTSPAKMINHPWATTRAVSKIAFFQAMAASDGARIPEWTTSPTNAHRMHARGVNLVVRAEVSSSGGKGASILNGCHGSNLGASMA